MATMVQALEKTIGISADDFKQLVPALRGAVSEARSQYLKGTPPKLRLLDNLIALCIVTFAMQVCYGVLFNRDPFYSFIAGVFCSLGIFAMTASLRVQLTDRATFESYTTKRLVFDYILGCLLVFFATLLLMG